MTLMLAMRALHYLHPDERAFMCSECGAMHWLISTDTSCPSCELRPDEWVLLHYAVKSKVWG